MKIVVLAKEVPDTASARTLDSTTGMLHRAASEVVPDEINERTLEHALQYRDAGGKPEIVVLSVGPASAEASVRKLLAMGADSAVIVSDDSIAGSDAVRTSQIISQAVSKIEPDLILAGTESTDGASGVVPAMLAERLGWALMPSLNNFEIREDAVSGALHIDGESVALSAALPAVASVTEQSAEPRFPNFKGIMKAKKKTLEVWDLAELGDVDAPSAASVMVSADARPAREPGPKVTDDGNAAEQLVEFLASNRLI